MPSLYLGLILFICGVALAYFVVLPMTFKFLQSFLTAVAAQQIMVGPLHSRLSSSPARFWRGVRNAGGSDGVVRRLAWSLQVSGVEAPVCARWRRDHGAYPATPGDALTIRCS